MDPAAEGEASARPASTSPRPAPANPPSRRWAAAPLVLSLFVAAYGLLLRAWVLAHVPLNSDEAVVGLVARGILAGHFVTFYWGQQYGGAEPYLVAAVIWLVHGSPMGIGGTAALLSAVAAALVGLVVAEATANRWLGAVAGALTWVWPYAVVWNSLREYGFRGVSLVCGLLMVYVSLRVRHGRGGVSTGIVLGLAAGVGWWSSPEIGYFAVPVAVVLLASWDRLFTAGRRWSGPWKPRPALAAIAGAAVGALPWLYTNVHTGFASLSTASLPTYDGIGYGGRLSIFFRDMLPVQLGARTVPGGAWVGGTVVGPLLYGLLGAVVAAALALAALEARRGRRAAPLVAMTGGVAAFPFIYALVPSTGYWTDGRYGVDLPSLLVALLALALAGPERRPVPAADAQARTPRARHARRGPPHRRAVAVACAGLAGAGLLTTFTARAGGVPADRGFFSSWTDPDAAVRHVATEMTRHGIRYAYGSYWTAYVLDFLDPGAVVVSPSHLDVVRWPAEAAAVGSAPDPAWLFFSPSQVQEATRAFANPEPGPGDYTEAQFEGLLTGRGVAYRVVHLGVLDAVVPAHRVTLPAP
jgi:hypothetical protein